jgi:predicted small lipoprotein YifL
MKKIIALLLAFVMVFALCACGEQKPAEEEPEEIIVDDTPEGVMTHEEFLAAEEGTSVTFETYVQATQGWWDNKITVYAQSPDGAYFIYEMACTEEDAAKLVPGTKIRVTGDKAVWNGLVEVMDPTFEFVDGEPWIAEAADFAAIAAEGKLEEHMNEYFTVEGTIAAKGDDGAAFFFNWDNSGEDGNCDLYFDVEVNGETYTFVVRRYLTAPGGEVYEGVKGLQVGDTVEITGFLYWYEGPQPHITSITVK